MSRFLWITGVLIVTLALMPVLGFAAEHGGQEHGGSSSAPASTSSAPSTSHSSAAATSPSTTPSQATPSATASPAPMTPSTPPALKPIVITFSGELSAMDTKTTPAMVTVQDRYGVRKEITVPSEAKITKGTETKSSADLKVGDKLTVEYTYDVATGKRTAQSITVGEAAPQPAGQ